MDLVIETLIHPFSLKDNCKMLWFLGSKNTNDNFLLQHNSFFINIINEVLMTFECFFMMKCNFFKTKNTFWIKGSLTRTKNNITSKLFYAVSPKVLYCAVLVRYWQHGQSKYKPTVVKKNENTFNKKFRIKSGFY